MSEALQREFGIADAVDIVPGVGELPKVVLRHARGARAEVYLHGGHVTSFVPANGREVFFLSREAVFAPDTAIRGGVPVIFPQFGNRGPLSSHGFARVSAWTLARSARDEDDTVVVTLRLTESPATLAVWPHRFTLDLDVRLDAETLTLGLAITNTDTLAWSCTTALHSYFAVGDIERTRVEGLRDTAYLDALREHACAMERASAVTFTGEVDRVYLNTPPTVRIVDGARGRDITLTKDHMPDVVVWNPWIDKAQRLRDFGNDEYREMVCVETGVIDQPAIVLPASTWRGETVFIPSPTLTR